MPGVRQHAGDRASPLARAERAAALLLQRSLVPAQLTHIPGLELAARYVPAGDREVGGDWYDVFRSPSGRLCLVVGESWDAGCKPRSPSPASAARCAPTPWRPQLLGKVDRHAHCFGSDVMATAVCALVEPTGDRLLLASAGHPPPVSIQPGQTAMFLDPPTDLPLTITPEPGTRRCFYTDGLVERRSEPIDTGLERLRPSMIAAPAETVCATVMSELLGAEPTTDDVALVVLHRLEDP